MSITFACSFCNRSLTVDDKLAGKRGKCKSCGAVMKVPQLAVATGGLNVEDLYGVDDAPAISAGAMPARGRAPAADSTPRASRAKTRGDEKPKRKKSESGSGPWGVPIRRAGCALLVSSLIISRILRLVPSEYKTGQLLAFCAFVSMCAIGVGVLLTLASLVGATVSFVTGNRQAFHSESMGEMGGWLIACLLSLGAVAAFGYGFMHPSSTLARALHPGDAPRQGFPAVPPRPGAAPWPAAGSPAQRTVKVTLSNGRFMQNTGTFGTPRPGVEISVDYSIESGELVGPERFVLVIKSGKGLGELDHLDMMRFRRSGTISASSFMASPAEGPYEAWLETVPMPGAPGERKQVSNTISLQFTDVPVHDPAAEARPATKERRRQMTNPPPGQQNGPGLRQPGRNVPGRGRSAPGPF